MCIEIYSSQQPIQIPFEHERISFMSPHSYRGQYTILVRNVGKQPIRQLLLLYPRPLLSVEGESIKLSGIVDVVEQLPTSLHLPTSGKRQVHLDGKLLSMEIPNPNDPTKNIPNVTGTFDPDNSKFSLPPGFKQRHVRLLNSHNDGVSGWAIVLREPIQPNEGHWFAMTVTVDRVGKLLPYSVFDGLHQTFHAFASPLWVRRTVKEILEVAIQDCELFDKDDDADDKPYYESLLKVFGLNAKRDVDIQYYELTVESGEPRERTVLSSLAEGNLRMRSGSPHIQTYESENGPWQEPVYEWKAGSIISGEDPDFTLRLTFCHPPL